jgi:hypothetical protein
MLSTKERVNVGIKCLRSAPRKPRTEQIAERGGVELVVVDVTIVVPTQFSLHSDVIGEIPCERADAPVRSECRDRLGRVIPQEGVSKQRTFFIRTLLHIYLVNGPPAARLFARLTCWTDALHRRRL